MPLSFAQRRLWFLYRLEGPGSTYNGAAVLRISGALDAQALRAALGDVMARHEALRTVFPEVDGRPYQHILPAAEARPEVSVETLDEAELAAAVDRAVRHPFDLATELPLRASLFTTDEHRHMLVLVIHHIAGDGWSMGPLSRDLSAAYAARRAGRAPTWTPLPVQYADYTLWQRELLGAEDDPESLLAAQVGYWREALAGIPERLELPTDRPYPERAGYEGGAVPVRVDAALHRALIDLARSRQTTVFMVLQAAVGVLLHRLGAGTDIPIGSLAHHPLFQVMLAFNSNPRGELSFAGAKATPQETRIGAARMDLTVHLAERRGDDGSPDGIVGSLTYRTDLFEQDTVTAL
ncbi:condensation domain-containing protein, partial [Streptomyces flavovariabilis]|uniref:condensation domain-containing protein n=1 Tax=Streptomyces flavovariabilis TaxID=284031 RepID=UPI001FCCB527